MFLTHLTDEELVEQLRVGNDKAFDCLYFRYRDALVHAARLRIKDHDLAQELMQEIMTDVWVRRHQIHINTSVAAYMHTAMRYAILEYIRKQARKDEYIQEILSTVPSHSIEAGRDDDDLLLLKMDDCIADLPDKCREVLLLNRFDQLSVAAISEKLNISKNTTKYHLKHAMKLLRAGLKQLMIGFPVLMSSIYYVLQHGINNFIT